MQSCCSGVGGRSGWQRQGKKHYIKVHISLSLLLCVLSPRKQPTGVRAYPLGCGRPPPSSKGAYGHSHNSIQSLVSLDQPQAPSAHMLVRKCVHDRACFVHATHPNPTTRIHQQIMHSPNTVQGRPPYHPYHPEQRPRPTTCHAPQQTLQQRKLPNHQHDFTELSAWQHAPASPHRHTSTHKPHLSNPCPQVCRNITTTQPYMQIYFLVQTYGLEQTLGSCPGGGCMPASWQGALLLHSRHSTVNNQATHNQHPQNHCQLKISSTTEHTHSTVKGSGNNMLLSAIYPHHRVWILCDCSCVTEYSQGCMGWHRPCCRYSQHNTVDLGSLCASAAMARQRLQTVQYTWHRCLATLQKDCWQHTR